MAWKSGPGTIATRWADDVSPESAWREYPRPQLTRSQWLNLNGLWEYAVLPRGSEPRAFEGEILVPFCIESALSGVERPLAPSEWLWYRRTFRVPEEWCGRRIVLHFGAVDWEATVWVNGQKAGSHRGGYLPFCFDVTRYLHPLLPGEERLNELRVRVWDPTDRHWQQRGKQVLKPKGIWYTAVSGIWQTVWLEPVPDVCVEGLKLTPDVDSSSLRVETRMDGDVAGLDLHVVASEGGSVVASGAGPAGKPITLSIPSARLWSPDDPSLYDLKVELRRDEEVIDRVGSYFGMRKVGLTKDSQGRTRLCLNGRALFQYGPLDQGYWPDGLYTPPSEDAMRADVALVKALGCNMLRKHVKVEPARFYYECDRQGLIVWQDMPNGGRAVGEVLSFLAILSGRLRRRDNRLRWRAGRGIAAAREDYRRELREMVDNLHSFPCVCAWVPFNEGWGQFDSVEVARWLGAYDPTRPVDHASGWFDHGAGQMRSLHVYFKPLPGGDPDRLRAVVLSEFGGYSLRIAGHEWDAREEFGYRKLDSPQALTAAYIELLEEQLTPWIRRGLSAAVYTQATDVETEVNGFVTYDRAVEKMDVGRVAAVHRRLYEVSERG
ncbi:MAG TPA: glycoside hydrolase family 2 TIM barrel-domain containing protein [Anaerolineae bacterium]|nr:glycoside hydrolase family 2 TIM barrel-domain containing protein [Anaerolineae bacterium]